MRSVYADLCRRTMIAYVPPRANTYSTWGGTYQRVRLPSELILPSGRGMGDCVDLSLLLASCAERLGLSPMLLVLGDRPDRPRHALFGCWPSVAGPIAPLWRDKRELIVEAEEGRLLLLEATGVCAGSHRLGFSRARAKALQILRRARWCDGVDVKSVRPPFGCIRPLVMSADAFAARACEEAERLRARKRIGLRETPHLLYGLAAAGGAATSQLFAACGADPEQLARTIETLVAPGNTEGAPETTVNWERCMDDARRRAREAGSDFMREVDLLWGLLQSPSRSVDHVLANAGLTRERLLDCFTSMLGAERAKPKTRELGGAPS
jgi:hypothetical protein